MKNMKLEYIFSGLGFFKLNNPRINDDPELIENIASIFKSFNEYYPNNPCSVLFNAFTEADQGDLVKQYGTKVYVDSGGLQIITTKNKVLDDNMKMQIYDNQTAGDYAMCFDEIPLYIDEAMKGASARTEMAGKFVVGEHVYDKGISTGKNIKQQIEFFKQGKHKTKVFIILQGNSPEDWINFSNGVFEQIEWDEDIDYIEGLAIADTCIGNGILEAADMYSIIPKLNCPDIIKKRLHLLGVGSIGRLAPIIAMVNSGYLPKETHISYDSTSLSSSHVFGRYKSGTGKTYNFGRVEPDDHVPAEFDIILSEIQDNMTRLGVNEVSKMNYEEFRHYFLDSTSRSFKAIWEHECPEVEKEKLHNGIIMFVMFIISQGMNFTEQLNEIIKDSESFLSFLSKTSKTKILVSLTNVTNYEEYLKWREFAIASNIHSNRIARVDTYEKFEKISGNQKSIDDWI